MEEFKKLGLSKNSIEALEKKGFSEPTTIQAQVIPLLLKGEKDVVGQSQTGTGKTASFALPILEKIEEHSKTIQAIVLTPTRELALQVSKEIESLKGKKKVKVLAVYGGASIRDQRQKLMGGIDIVVGTPGRVMDLQERRSLRLHDIKYAVLDEADEMLNMGFVEDIKRILENTPEDKNMLLFSATMPKAILRIAERYMRKYEFIEVEKSNVITQTVEQIYYDIDGRDRVEGLRRIIDFCVDFHGIVFCNTKSAVDTLTQQLTRLNYSAAALHGDITQGQREKILQQFRNRQVKVLVATDVAARGIDVNDLTHVVNYSLPQSPEAYVHRIGRTGRAGKKGISITFVMPSERGKLKFVERMNNCKLEKRKFPTSKEILEHKESEIKTIIGEIIEGTKGRETKYTEIAKDLLKEHKVEEVVVAVLKYSLKNELSNTSYKEIHEPKFLAGRSSSGSYGGRGGYNGRGGRRRRSRGGNRSGGRGRSRGNRSCGQGQSNGSRSERPQNSGFRQRRRSSSSRNRGARRNPNRR